MAWGVALSQIIDTPLHAMIPEP